MLPSDNQPLADSAIQGDFASLMSLLESHLPQLVAYIRLHAGPWLKEKESCADLAHSVCREVLEDMGDFDYRSEPQFRKWLFQKTMSKIADRYRYYHAGKRKANLEQDSTLEQVPASFESPSQVAINNEDLERLEQAFQHLSEDHRQVITFARIIGLSHAETGAEMNRSPQAVAAMLCRAMARLAWLMNE